MEHLALKIDLSLKEFCDRVSVILDFPEFLFGFENETEWGESSKDGLTINISQPYEDGKLHQWDQTVPKKSNFGISLSKNKIKNAEIEYVGNLIAGEFKVIVYYHRTWLRPGENIERNVVFNSSKV